MKEKRRSKRTDISVRVSLTQLGDNFVTGFSGNSIEVDVVNISKDGMAFKSAHEFKLNTYHDTVIKLENHDKFEAVIEIVRMENLGEAETTFGCRFVGINSEDQFKIEVYQIVHESNNNTDK